MNDDSSDIEMKGETNYDDSDVDENDKYEDDDIFNNNKTEYKKVPAFPVIPCPTNDNAKNYEYLFFNLVMLKSVKRIRLTFNLGSILRNY